MLLVVVSLFASTIQAEYLYEDAMTTIGTSFVVAFFRSHRCDQNPILHIVTPYTDNVKIDISSPIWDSSDSFYFVNYTNSSDSLDVLLPISLCIDSPIIGNKTVLINSTKPIFLFVSDIQDHSGDYFSIYPLKSLGEEYVAAGYDSDSTELSVIGCIALHDDTEISVKVPKIQTFYFDSNTYNGESMINTKLAKYQFLRVDGTDVTGSFITSNKPIAVFSGHEFAKVPGPIRSNGESARGNDLIMSQIPLISSMSTIYPIVSTQINDEEWVRVIAIHNNTEFYIYSDGAEQQCFIEDRGSFYEFSVPQSSGATVVSNTTVSVAQYSASSSATGDPRLIMTLSLDNYVDEYTFEVPSGYYADKFTHLIAIVATASAMDRIYIVEENVNIYIKDMDQEGVPVSCGYADLVSVWLKVDPGRYTLRCDLIGTERCTVYIHGYEVDNQYGTDANRYIGSSETFQNSKLKKAEFSSNGDIVAFSKKVVKNNKHPSTSPAYSRKIRSSIECQIICRQYSNCDVVVFDKTELICKLYTKYATSSTLEDKPGTVIYL